MLSFFKKNLFYLFLSLVMVPGSQAQTYQKISFGIETVLDSIRTEIRFYGPSTVRIVRYPRGGTFNKESLSVIKKPEQTAFRTKQQGDLLSLETAGLQVRVQLSTGAISYYTPAGALLLQEKAGSSKLTAFQDVGTSTFSVTQAFLPEKDEALYGLGSQQEGRMIQRNLKLNMVQGNTDDYIPFFQSVKGYGVFWDNYSPTTFSDTPEETYFQSQVGDGIDYYFMYGGNADGVIANMRDLTGQVPMFPLWTYGFWQSRERYKSQGELVDVVQKYRNLKVPLDGIIQDWQYWGDNYLWNAMDFLNPEFPNPRKMVDDVHGLKARMIISIWSSFGPQTKPYRELKDSGMLMNFTTWPESGIDKWPPRLDYPSGVQVYDAYHPRARDIYWKYANKGLFSLGIDGWWMDSSEPDHLQSKESDFDNKTYLGSFRKVRNAYPLMTVGGVYQHQRATSNDKRVFILTRSAFAGQQRYGANTWSGDVVASWSALKKQITAGLNFSLCGIPHWNSDIGGFFLWNFKQPLRNADYRELYTRWLQFGTFCPMMRSHGTDAPREIYQFGSKGDKVYDAVERYIHLRYRLLPYIYAASWDVTARQSSIMRALVMDFPRDKTAIATGDAFMFGKSLLVSPVTEAQYLQPAANGNEAVRTADFSTVKTKEVYLPEGTRWFDFWTGESFQGGRKLNRETPLDIIPLYVKAGSIIPFGPAVQYATEKPWDSLALRIYGGADATFLLYEDEKDNYNYEKGSYSTITFNWNDAKQQLTIADRKGSFPGMLTDRVFRIVRVGAGKGGYSTEEQAYDKVIRYTGKQVAVKL